LGSSILPTTGSLFNDNPIYSKGQHSIDPLKSYDEKGSKSRQIFGTVINSNGWETPSFVHFKRGGIVISSPLPRPHKMKMYFREHHNSKPTLSSVQIWLAK
jgi:hypothetical protein